MSSAALTDGPRPSAPKVRPDWLRPTALSLAVAAHCALLFFARTDVNAPPSLDTMTIGLVPEGDATVDQMSQEDIKPQEENAEEPAPAAPAQAAELTAAPPLQAAPDAPPLPSAKPKPDLNPKQQAAQEDNEPSPTELREIKRKKRWAEHRRREDRKAQEGRQAAHRGAAGGSRTASGLSAANFAGLVIAQLNRHKFYPEAARASGVTGSVGVAFTIGPSGRIVSQSITRSSGSGILDGAARSIMTSLRTPTPPNGRFSTSTNINFHMH